MNNLVQYLQAAIPIDGRSIERIAGHLKNPRLVITGYCNLSGGEDTKNHSDNKLVILSLLWPHQNGPQCVFEILALRSLSEKDGSYHP